MHVKLYTVWFPPSRAIAANVVKTIDVSEKHEAVAVAVVDANRVKNTALFNKQAAA